MHTVRAHISRRCRPFAASAVLVPALLLALAAHTPAASGGKAAGAAFTQHRVVAHRSGVRPGYGWPVKPFNRQHPVRGYLNDPRPGDDGAKAFHFGIDISAPDGTAVYAVAAGKVFSTRHNAIAVKGATRTFGYWHIVPVVRNHQQVHLHELLGHVLQGERHVHFAERRGGEYLNPLRPGGLGPYADHSPPTVASVEFLRGGQEQDATSLTGRVNVVVEAFDTTPIPVPSPWSNLPVTPARIRWSVAHGSRGVVAPRTAVDFSRTMLPARLYDSVYAPGTQKNSPGAPGHYRFYLAHGFDASHLPAGVCHLRIKAVDTRGNLVVAEVEIARAAN
ncbi:MAG TPA: M23 family metallopeptidase [Gaiellaceae bacterium]|nr:M23 family metallopeptidase [Gaiellaceae bacterium]